jgi:hypothetical protein
MIIFVKLWLTTRPVFKTSNQERDANGGGDLGRPFNSNLAEGGSLTGTAADGGVASKGNMNETDAEAIDGVIIEELRANGSYGMGEFAAELGRETRPPTWKGEATDREVGSTWGHH